MIRNKTLLGTEDDKVHQAKTILATAAILEQREVTDINQLIQLHRRTKTIIESAVLEQLKDTYPIFYRGFAAVKSKAAMAAHVLSSGFDVEETDQAIDLIVISGDERDEMHTYPDTRWVAASTAERYWVRRHRPRAIPP